MGDPRGCRGIAVVAVIAAFDTLTRDPPPGQSSRDRQLLCAVLNGIVAPPLLVVVMLAARNPKVMRTQTIGPLLTTLGWTATTGMLFALVGLAYTTITR